MGCLFTLLMVSFEVQNFIILTKYHLSVFIFILFLVFEHKHCLIQGHKDLYLFSSKNFIVLTDIKFDDPF